MSEATNPKFNEVLDKIANFTVLELSEFVKAFETKFGVSAAAPVAMMAGPAAAAEAAPVKDTFDIILTSFGEKKIQVIKEVRAITGLGLKEAKDLVDGVPKPIKEGVSKADADKIKEQIMAAGGTVDLK